MIELRRWDVLTEECRLMHLTTTTAKIRLAAEIVMEISAVLYILGALREARFLGLNMFIENLVRLVSYNIIRVFLTAQTNKIRTADRDLYCEVS